MTSTLIAHCGPHKSVARNELALCEVPEATASWSPVSHESIVNIVMDCLADAGFKAAKEQFVLCRDAKQMFATVDLTTEIAEGVTLSTGIRNSVDKSLSAGLVAGGRVFVCDNLAFSGEIDITRKHTTNCEVDFEDKVRGGVETLDEYRGFEEARIDQLKRLTLPRLEAESFMLRAFEQGIIRSALLPKLIQEWRQPRHEEFETRNGWSMLNSFTEVLKERQQRNPIVAARETQKFQKLLVS